MKIFYNRKHALVAIVLLIAATSTILFRFAPLVWQSQSVSIVERDSIDAVFDYIKPDEYTHDTCVIFDIDNTLAKPHGHLASDQWFRWSIARLAKKGLSRHEAVEAVMPRLLQFMNALWMEPVEPITAAIIKALQDKGVFTMALTARSLDLTYRTIEQLNHIGITFNTKGPRNCPIIYGTGKPALYVDGILFSGNYRKGEVIAHWFDTINYHPKKIIFIDDILKNIESVQADLTQCHCQFVGIRYSHQDAFVKTLTPALIAQEYQEFMANFPESKPITPMHAY